MQNGMQLTLVGLNGRAGLIVSLMTVSIIWDQEPGEDFVIITRQADTFVCTSKKIFRVKPVEAVIYMQPEQNLRESGSVIILHAKVKEISG